MSSLTVAGGVYYENCIWPEWNQIFGSGGRAAVAATSHVAQVNLLTYATTDSANAFRPAADLYGLQVETSPSAQDLAFHYVHGLSRPGIQPSIRHLRQNNPIDATGDVVLRFGMLEGSAKVDAECCIYDPQSAFEPLKFDTNGSQANRLAIVGNRGEIIAMTDATDPETGAVKLIADGAEVVVIKSGPTGAHVITASSSCLVKPRRSNRVWKIGSGDVFAAIFAARWGVHGDAPNVAAELASSAVAHYVDTMALPSPTADDLTNMSLPQSQVKEGKVYLASPFFNLGQRWLVDEARSALLDLGMDVFSPVHDVGHGAAAMVAKADLEALHECDRVFAILDGMDSGTLFEVGYARAMGLPVYALAQSVEPEALKMVSGSECRVYDDLVTALHHTAWCT